MNPNSIEIIAVCPNCKEAVRINLNKKETKVIFKSFKMGMKEGQEYRERMLKKCRP